MGNSDPNRSKDLTQFQSPLNENEYKNAHLLNGESFSIKSHWIYKVMGWLVLLSCLADIIGSVRVGNFDQSFLSVSEGMMILSVFLLMMARSSIYVDGQSIIIVRTFGRYQMKWDEMKRIVFDKKLRKIIFYGSDKWLVMPRIVSFASGRRFGVADYVNVQVKLRRIPVEFSDKTPNRSKNTMVSFF